MKFGQTQRHPEWRIIVDLLRAADWGEVVTDRTIADATGLKADTRLYYRHVAQARKVLLRDHEILMLREVKVGYKRGNPRDYGPDARRDLRLGDRRHRLAERKLGAAPAHRLTAQEVKELEHAMMLVKAIRQATRQAYRTMKNVLTAVQPHRALSEAREAHEQETTGQQPH